MLSRKRIQMRLLAAAALLALPTLALGQGYYDDDIYYNGDKAEKQLKETIRTEYQTPRTVIYNNNYYGTTADYPSADTYTVRTSSTRDIDEYNRRGQFLVPDTLANDTADLDCFANTRRIEKFHNGDIVSGSKDQQLQEYYYTSEPCNTVVNIYLNGTTYCRPGWSFGWSYYDPWFDPWYDPWYRPWGGWGWSWGYDPWYRPWGWDPWYRPWGWDPWYRPWGPGPGPAPIIVPNNSWGNRRPGTNPVWASTGTGSGSTRPGAAGSFASYGNRRASSGAITRADGTIDRNNSSVIGNRRGTTFNRGTASGNSSSSYQSGNRRGSTSTVRPNSGTTQRSSAVNGGRVSGSSFGGTRSSGSSSSSSGFGSGRSSSSSSSSSSFGSGRSSSGFGGGGGGFSGGGRSGGGGGGFSGGGGGGGRRR